MPGLVAASIPIIDSEHRVDDGSGEHVAILVMGTGEVVVVVVILGESQQLRVDRVGAIQVGGDLRDLPELGHVHEVNEVRADTGTGPWFAAVIRLGSRPRAGWARVESPSTPLAGAEGIGPTPGVSRSVYISTVPPGAAACGVSPSTYVPSSPAGELGDAIHPFRST